MRQLRAERGWTNNEMAKRARVGAQNMANLLCGTRTVSLKNALTLARSLRSDQVEMASACMQDMLKRDGLNFTVHLHPVEH